MNRIEYNNKTAELSRFNIKQSNEAKTDSAFIISIVFNDDTEVIDDLNKNAYANTDIIFSGEKFNYKIKGINCMPICFNENEKSFDIYCEQLIYLR